ncbi:MAG TPA: hypothetical protein VH744_07255, partial [Terriglobales bacterium]
CLRFAGKALLPALAPGFEHLAIDTDGQPDLTVCIWDAQSTGVSLPRPAWSGRVYGPRGDVQGFNNERINTSYCFGAAALSMYDAHRRQAIYCTRDASQLPSWEKGSPLRTILHWGLRTHNLQLCHGAALGRPEGGVLLAGKGGSGKSTTALRCLQSQLLYAGDDYCVVQTEPNPYVHSLYNTAKVNADNVNRVSFLRSAITNWGRLDTQKALMFLQQHYPEKLSEGFPIRAVLIPRVTGRVSTGVTPARCDDALAALALSTIRQLPGADNWSMQMIRSVTDRVPCYYLELGTDLDQIPGVILDVIAKCGKP